MESEGKLPHMRWDRRGSPASMNSTGNLAEPIGPKPSTVAPALSSAYSLAQPSIQPLLTGGQVPATYNNAGAGGRDAYNSSSHGVTSLSTGWDRTRIPPKPRPPAAEKERHGPAYSIELLEYVSTCMEYWLEVYPQSTMGTMSAFPKRSSLVGGAVGRSGSMSSGLGRHTASTSKQSATADSVPLDLHDPNAPSGGQLQAEFSEASSATTAHQGPVYLDRAWPVSVVIRGGLSGPGPQISKEKARQLMGKSMTNAFSDRHAKNFGRRKSDGGSGWRLKDLVSVRDPNSSFLRWFDVAASLALANDVLVTPFVLAWEIEVTTLVSILAMISAVYWTLFMVVKFFTGFYESGELRMTHKDVAKRYLRTTFIFDLSLTVMDWVMILLRRNSADRNLRLLRLVRMVKIMRISRIWELVETLVESYAAVGGRSKLVVYLIQVTIVTAVFCHVMCCAWFWLGRDGESDTGARWLELWLQAQMGSLMGSVTGETFVATDLYQYCVCFHWTLAQLTLGSSDVYPVNSSERIVNVLLLLTGVIFNATIVSLISSQALEYIANRREQTLKLTMLKRFLEQHKVHTELAVQVQRQVTERINASATVLFEEDVRALEMLSSDLQDQVMLEVKMPPLLGHGLFRVWLDADEKCVKALCKRLKFEAFKAQDCVFRPGTEAHGMARVAEGRLFYVQDRETSKEAEDVMSDVEKGTSISEAALWAKWKHVGKLECVKQCSLLIITAEGLFETLPKFPLIHHITKQYGRAFHLRITLARPPYSGWPNDLEVPHTDPSDLLGQEIGHHMLLRERQKPKAESMIAAMPEEEYKQLLLEVEQETCAVQASDDGTLERIVAVVCVQVVRDDARILCQLGKFDKQKGALSISCALPGMKRPRGVLPSQTCEQLIRKDLAFISRGLTFLGADTVVEVKESASLGMLTKYLRTIQHASLDANFEWPHDIIEVLVQDAFQKPVRSISRVSARQRSGRNSQADAVMGDLSEEPIVLRDHESKVVLYSWLSPSTFQFLQSDHGKPLLERWVGALDVVACLEGDFSSVDPAEGPESPGEGTSIGHAYSSSKNSRAEHSVSFDLNEGTRMSHI